MHVMLIDGNGGSGKISSQIMGDNTRKWHPFKI